MAWRAVQRACSPSDPSTTSSHTNADGPQIPKPTHIHAGRPDFGLFQPYHAVRFDDSLREVWSISLRGKPSRVRISPDGHLAAIMVFMAGHSYAEAGFSTLTTLVDLDTGKTLTDLEQFAVTKDGGEFHAVDFNFWGVTFTADSRHFYATLVETPLAETRSIDDQVEWLDDRRILYTAEGSEGSAEVTTTDTWVVAADGTGQPEEYRGATDSPSVINASPKAP